MPCRMLGRVHWQSDRIRGQLRAPHERTVNSSGSFVAASGACVRRIASLNSAADRPGSNVRA